MNNTTSEKTNPRTERAREALKQAAFRLASKRPVPEITLTEIAEEAGVSRPTVYKLFDDVPTLVAQTALEYLSDAIKWIDEEQLESLSDDASLDDVWEKAYFEELMVRFIDHVYSARDFYYNAVYGPSMSQIMIGFTQILDERMMTHRIGRRFQRNDSLDDQRADDYRAALSAGVVWLVVRWLDSDFTDANSPDAIAERVASTLFSLSNTGQ